jgi:hypothetical protein
MRCLTLKGVVFDTITELSERIGSELSPMPQHWYRNRNWLWKYMERTHFLSRYEKNPRGETEAFWRTLIANVTAEEEIAPDHYVVCFEGWKQCLCTQPSLNVDGELTVDPIAAALAFEFGKAMGQFAMHRKFCLTKKGYIGLAPLNAAEGDVVAVLNGGRVPFILRRLENGKFQLVGEAYVHGLMRGEFDVFGSEGNQEQSIELV